MNLDQAIKIVREAFERRMKLWESKNRDYANTNTLANFDVMAELHRTFRDHGMPIDMTTSVGVAMNYQLIKFCRRLNLYKKGVTPENESIIDSLDDMSNYVDLEMLCFLAGEENRKNYPIEVDWKDQCQRTNCFKLATFHCSCGFKFCQDHGIEHIPNIKCGINLYQEETKFTVCPECEKQTVKEVPIHGTNDCFHVCTTCSWTDVPNYVRRG